MAYDKSSKGVIMTYSHPALAIPRKIQVAGNDRWMELDDVTTGEMETTVDGFQVGHVIANHVTGSVTLTPGSPSVSFFASVEKVQYEAGTSIFGMLAMVSVTPGLWAFDFKNFMITSPLKGYSFGKKVDEITFKFSASIPNYSLLGEAIEAGLSIADILAGNF